MARSKKPIPPPRDNHPTVAYVSLSVSLDDLRKRKFFADWSDYVEPANLRKARRVVRDLIDELIALQGSDQVATFDAFREAVERLNAADMEDQFIDTIEREDLCDVIDQIAAAAGLDDYDVTAWRDW
jgi:predicted house-cleaning noncanonical NTP pyrophosphatase (MazG superfamily)